MGGESMASSHRLLRFLASSAFSIAAGALVAAALASERRRQVETALRQRWQRARQAAESEAVETEQEHWARFRQLVGLSSQDGLPRDITPRSH